MKTPTHLVSFVNPLIGTATQDVVDPCIPGGGAGVKTIPNQSRGGAADYMMNVGGENPPNDWTHS